MWLAWALHETSYLTWVGIVYPFVPENQKKHPYQQWCNDRVAPANNNNNNNNNNNKDDDNKISW